MSVSESCEKNSDILPVSMQSISRLLILDISYCAFRVIRVNVRLLIFISDWWLKALIILLNKSIYSLFGRNHRELLLVKGVHVDRSILDIHLASVEVGHATVGVDHEILVVTIGVVVSGMGAS